MKRVFIIKKIHNLTTQIDERVIAVCDDDGETVKDALLESAKEHFNKREYNTCLLPYNELSTFLSAITNMFNKGLTTIYDPNCDAYKWEVETHEVLKTDYVKKVIEHLKAKNKEVTSVAIPTDKVKIYLHDLSGEAEIIKCHHAVINLTSCKIKLYDTPKETAYWRLDDLNRTMQQRFYEYVKAIK